MAKQKPKKSAVEQAYNRELKRIRQFIRRAEKRGYSFGAYTLPEKPSRITRKSVEKLKKITPKILYEKATYYDVITDTRVSGTEAQRLIRSRASKKAAQTRHAKKNKSTFTVPNKPPVETDEVLQYMEELLANWQPLSHWDASYERLKRNDKNILQNIVNGAVSQLGRNQVARNIQSQAGLVKDLAFKICYGSSDFKWGDVQGDISAITAIIYGRNLTVEESKAVQDIIDSTLGYETPQ